MMRIRPYALVAAIAIILAVTSCAAGPPAESPASSSTAAESPSPTGGADRAPTHTPAPAIDAALQAELVEMLTQDQASRLGGESVGSDQERTERLAEIIADHGWPGISLVGEDGEDAAWAIAQHSDLDPEFQRLALAYLTAAVEAGDASPGNLAYLTDRVAAGAGDPQTYGTQVGCGEDGPVPGTPILDEANVDERRADAGLAPLADYYAEMAVICAEVE